MAQTDDRTYNASDDVTVHIVMRKPKENHLFMIILIVLTLLFVVATIWNGWGIVKLIL
jgi:hypothetical protein